ncbi:MAG: sugar kinase [Clostridiales bacterium]|nr:sugar kinase [Clostridiales bacterium]
MAKVVTFGEIMLRLSPEGYYRFTQADRFEATYGGAEANVAVSLSNFGVDTAFVTKLPENLIGDAALNAVRKFGVDTRFIKRGGGRLGIYFLEKGASQRPSLVVYDRKSSAFSLSEDSDYNWDEIFNGAKWFHFTGITPALSDLTAGICLKAVRKAKEMGLTVSCDINYRKNLCSKEKAREVMTELSKYIDICIANEEDAADVFDIHADNSDIQSGVIDTNAYAQVASKLCKKYGFKMTAITLRSSISASDNNWAALISDGVNYEISKSYKIHIVDRVGGGDSFGAGLIYSLLNGRDMKEAVEFATAASCLKHSIEGDFNLVSIKEVNALMAGDGSGRVKR